MYKKAVCHKTYGFCLCRFSLTVLFEISQSNIGEQGIG